VGKEGTNGCGGGGEVQMVRFQEMEMNEVDEVGSGRWPAGGEEAV
jgi:hypothetical protein